MKLAEILYQKTNDELHTLAKLCDYSGVKRKDDLVGHLLQQLLTPSSLPRLWRRLDDLSQKAVAAAYHNEGEFEAGAFIARYGALPERPQSRWSWYAEPILVDVFIYNGHLPDDVRPLLADLVPPPERFQVQGLATRPILLTEEGYPLEMICAETEQAGLHDLKAYLHLVDQGRLKVTQSTGRTTIASIRKVVDNLLEEDFLPLEEKYRVADVIRPFGLDMFAQGGGLVKKTRGANSLTLTEAGRAFYQTQEPEILLEAFHTWVESSNFDEIHRISALKGLNSRGTRLSDPAGRRDQIIEALSWCPVDVWIDLEEFYRAVKIWHFDFEVETTHYSNLYVGYKDYGSLYGEAYWRVVKGLYINALIWEYLASIGAVDLLYIEPEAAYFETGMDYFYNYDDLPYSLYDGLKYFRINNLGAYLLGQAGQYISSTPPDPAVFTISDDLTVAVTDPDRLTPYDANLLDQLAVPARNGLYRLDTRCLLTALEEGADLTHLTDFLYSRHTGPLPEAVPTWLAMIEERSRAFKLAGQALLIKVKSPALVKLVLADSKLSKFCKRLDDKTIVIPANKEKAFRKQLKELEYILVA